MSVDVLRHTNQDKVLHSFFTIITVLISMSHIWSQSNHGGDLGNSTETIVHIWSFTTGYYPSDHYPCDNNALASLPFVGEDYFCERGVTVSSTESNPRNQLWDGAACEDGNDCCSRIKHPYFIKHLLTPTTNNIDLRFLNSVYAIELYVK